PCKALADLCARLRDISRWADSDRKLTRVNTGALERSFESWTLSGSSFVAVRCVLYGMVVVYGVVSLLDCGAFAEAKLLLLSICHYFFITIFTDGLAIFLEQQPHRRVHH